MDELVAHTMKQSSYRSSRKAAVYRGSERKSEEDGGGGGEAVERERERVDVVPVEHREEYASEHWDSGTQCAWVQLVRLLLCRDVSRA